MIPRMESPPPNIRANYTPSSFSNPADSHSPDTTSGFSSSGQTSSLRAQPSWLTSIIVEMTPSADAAKDPHTDQHSQQSSLQPVFDSPAPQHDQNATPESQANGYPPSSSTSQPLTQA